MNVTIVDYNSGNISSVINSFKEVAQNKVNIEVTSDLNKIKFSDKVVLPGQGSFKSCVDALNKINGLSDTLNEFAINNKNLFLEFVLACKCSLILVMKKLKQKDWVDSGKVSEIDNQNGKFKLPRIGWNQINIVNSKIFKMLKIILICILFTVMNLFQKIRMYYPQQLIIHQILFVLLKKKIFSEPNFILKKK